MVKKYNNNEIDILADILKNDGVISVPTDTVYGICSRISSKKAHDNLVEIKKRPEIKSFPVMCANKDQIKGIAIVDNISEKIIDKFMPGPVTIILKKKEEIQDYITNGKTTIAIRMATSEDLKELILKVESPLFMTSANISGESTCKTINEIEKTFPNIDGILEGEIQFGKASTIIDCTSDEIKVLRQGPVTIEQIKSIL